jgi:hypothetical protein
VYAKTLFLPESRVGLHLNRCFWPVFWPRPILRPELRNFHPATLGSGVDFIGIHRQRKWMTFSLKIGVFLSSTPPQTLMNPMWQLTPSALGAGGRRFKSSRPDQPDEGTRGKLPVIASELAFGF